MTTPRIEEMVKEFDDFTFGSGATSKVVFRDRLRKALTEAHQAGIDEAVEIVKKAKDKYGTDGNSHCEADECPTCQWNIGAKWSSNKALDDTIKTLQDKK